MKAETKSCVGCKAGTPHRHGDRCAGCELGNPWMCLSFQGTAPAHAADHAAWLRRRARDRQRQNELEAKEARIFRRDEVGA